MQKLNYLSEAENKQRDQIIEDLNNAYRQRSQTWVELDDQTYDRWYIANKKAATGYIRPKLNKQDIRTVTGTTREKCNIIVAAMLKYNFDFNLIAFDKEDMPQLDLANGIGDLVRKSRLLEQPTYDDKRALIYTEFVSQGNVFLLESHVEEEVVRKRMDAKPFDDAFQANWTEAKELVKRCEMDMVPGINVYLGNMREYYMDKQPFIGLRREIHETEAEALYGHTKRWQQAKEEQNTHVLNDQGEQEYNNWMMITPLKQFKEEIRYFNIRTNTYQVLLDGVPMFPENFPLEYLNGVLKYPLVKWNCEPISRYFAYCRGISSKNKFNQAMADEMFRIILLKFRQSTTPAVSNMTGKTLNKSIFYPSTIHQGVDPDKIKPLGITNGVTSSEFEIFQLIKSSIDEASVSPIMGGAPTGGRQTASQFSQLAALALQKLGMIMVGAIQGEEELLWLRTYNILTNWTSPLDGTLDKIKGEIGKYRTESIGTQFSDGKSGIHTVRMMKKPLPGPNQTLAEENILSRRKGVDVRITNLDVDALTSLKYKFKYTVTTVDKEHTELKGALFEESMLKAKQIWPTAVNDAYAQDQWATYKQLDPKKLFISNAPTPQGSLVMKNGNPYGGFSMPGMPQPGGQQAGSQSTPGSKTLAGQILPQTSQKTKIGLKTLLHQ